MPQVEDAVRENLLAEFSPIEMLRLSLDRWWLVCSIMLLGGFVGWLIYSIQPPIYEAKASVLTSIDFSNTGPLTQYEEDLMMDAVGGVLQSQEVIDRTLTKAAQQGTVVQRDAFKQNTFIERRLGIWELRVRSNSPKMAMQLANIWLDEGETALKDAYQSAYAAQAQTRYMDSLEACLQQAAQLPTHGTLCAGADLAQIQSELQKASSALAKEEVSSRGILAGVAFGQPQPAISPSQPVIGARGSYVFAGAIIGFLVGFFTAQAGVRFPWSRKQ